MTDTHFFAPGKGKDSFWWNRALGTQSPRIAQSIIDTVKDLHPDFVIHCGDFTGHCSMDNYNYGIEIMNSLDCPWYVVVGNHDTWFPPVRQRISSLYGLSNDQCHYTRLINDIMFVFLDNCYYQTTDGSVSAYLDKESYDAGKIRGMSFCHSQIQWLDEQLRQNANRLVILVSHGPMDYREFYRIATLPNGERIKNHLVKLADRRFFVPGLRDEIVNVINSHSNIKVAFAGHWHINDMVVKNGVTYCQTASLREYPFEFRVVELDRDTLSVTTHQLNDKGLCEESFVDDWQNDWVVGSEADREFVIKVR